MAVFCHFWRMTPSEYRALTVEEYDALAGFQKRVAQEQRKAAKGR